MKKFYFLIFICFFSSLVYAQNVITGKITDSDGQAVPSASVTIEEPGKDAIIAYGISNAKGEFKVTFTSQQNEVEMKVKAFNHKSLVKTISNKTQTQNISLTSEATEIKEVKIKTKIITKKGDTISYDISSFANKNDRTLADVLKKFPGITVNKDGTVLYQNEPINKFYVNGKDLMEGGYGVINNALPQDAVKKVEIIENHQPVKMLQDKVPSENAALNVVMKNKVTMTGRGEVGSGFGSPWLWNLKLTPMFFGQKNQWVVNYKTNNVGEAVENEGNILAFGSSFEGRRIQVNQNEWLRVETASLPPVPEKRYLMNNVHYLSANLLTNPFKNKEWELKANASYTNNDVERTSTDYINNLQLNTKYTNSITNHFYTNKAKGELNFTKNAKKGFFKNTTTFTQFWNGDRALATINATSAKESIEAPTSSFQNSLSAIIPIKEKLLNVMSFINYQNDNQKLQVIPTSYLKFKDSQGNFVFNQSSDVAEQDFNIKTFEANQSVNLGFSKKNWTFTPEVGLNYTSNKLNSELFQKSGNSNATLGNVYTNDLNFSETVPYASLRINLKNENWMLFSNLPFNFNNIKAKDPLRSLDKSLNKFTFEPGFFLQYSFASFWKLSGSGNINYNFGDVQSMYSGVILLNPRSLNAINKDTPIMEIKSGSLSPRIEYRNPLNNLFFNIRYRYNQSDRNLIADLSVNNTGYTVRNYRAVNNGSFSNNYAAEIGKYFPKFKSNLSLNYGSNLSHSVTLQNSALIKNRNDSQNFGFKFNNTYFDWMSVDFNFTKTWSKQNLVNGTVNKSTDYNHNLSVYLYPFKNNTFGFNWDQINSGTTGLEYKNAFFDVSYQYTWDKKKIDFELKWQNIANRKVFERFSVSSLQEVYSTMQLRPSQVMLIVKFNFK